MKEVTLIDRAIERATKEGCIDQEEYEAWKNLKAELARISHSTGSAKCSCSIIGVNTSYGGCTACIDVDPECSIHGNTCDT